MLWGAFSNASSAMQVFTTDLGSISQNIANVNTNGYKRQEMMFATMMSEHKATPASQLAGLNIFGVQATQRNLIEAQGAIMPSTTWSDLAINGKGFFMIGMPQPGKAAAGASADTVGTAMTDVPTTVDTKDPSAVMYTRDGAWHRAYGPDTDDTLARSYFVNNQGGYLLGWMADDTGAIPPNATLQPVYTLAARPVANNGTAAVDDTSTLTPTQVTMPGRATTSASLRGNIPSSSDVSPSHFSSTMTVTDPNTSSSQTVTLDWVRSATSPSTWTISPSVDSSVGMVTSSPITVTMDAWGSVSGPLAGDDAITIDWTSGPADSTKMVFGDTSANTSAYVSDPNGNTQTVDLAWTRVSGSTWSVVPSFANGAVGTLDASPITVELDSGGNIVSPSATQNLSVAWDPSYGSNLPASTQLRLKAPAETFQTPTESIQKFPITVYDDQYNAHSVKLGFEHAGNNQWNLYVDGGTGADPLSAPAPVTIYFTNSGQIDTTRTTLPISTTLNWTVTKGEPPVSTPTTATFNLDLDKLTQYNSSLYTGTIEQDGYARGNLMATTFNELGELSGYYDNGRSRTLFKVPVANFVAPDSLEAVSGTMFRRTSQAGELTVSAIEKTPGEARFVTSSLEGSTVDIEDEFTRMIMTQKAYSLNSQVFRTADEMTTTARDIKS